MSVEPDPTSPDADDLRTQHQRVENAKLRAAESDDWTWLMGDAHGRRIVWRLLELAGVYRTTFDQNATQMAFNEGQRNVGLFMTAKIHAHAPHQFMKMREEAQTK